MSLFSDFENGCTQGSFLKRMHARVVLGTDARNQKDNFDGCTQRTFGQRIRARNGSNPECGQPTSRMHATPVIVQIRTLSPCFFLVRTCCSGAPLCLRVWQDSLARIRVGGRGRGEEEKYACFQMLVKTLEFFLTIVCTDSETRE